MNFMSIWGAGVKDNDRAFNFAIDVIRNGFENAKTNEEYLLLADMCLNYKYAIAGDELLKIFEVINEELLSLYTWEENLKGARLGVLLNLREKLRLTYIYKDKVVK